MNWIRKDERPCDWNVVVTTGLPRARTLLSLLYPIRGTISSVLSGHCLRQIYEDKGEAIMDSAHQQSRRQRGARQDSCGLRIVCFLICLNAASDGKS